MPSAITRAETRGSLRLWFGLLAAPLAWTVQVVIAPDLVELLCLPGTGEAGRGRLLGMAIEPLLVAMAAVLAVVAGAGALVAFQCSRGHKDGDDPSTGRRASWMALSGMLVSVLFLIAIVLNFLPPVLLDACEGFP